MSAYVYRLVHRPTGKFYLGSTDDIEYRKSRHLYNLKRGSHANIRLQKLYDRKKGKNFEWELFPVKNRKAAFKHEQYLLAKYNDNKLMLNIGMGAVGGDNLTRNPRRKEIIKSMSRSGKQVWKNLSEEEYRERVAHVQGENNPMFGRTHTKETRKKISDIHKGNAYTLGHKMSDEQKKQLSILASQRTGKKNPFFGKTHSDEFKKEQSERLKNRDPSAWTQSKQISVYGTVYRSLSEAGRQLGIPAPTLSYRAKSSKPDFNDIFYLE